MGGGDSFGVDGGGNGAGVNGDMGDGGCFYFRVYSMVESIYLLCLAVSRLKGVLVT